VGAELRVRDCCGAALLPAAKKRLTLSEGHEGSVAHSSIAVHGWSNIVALIPVERLSLSIGFLFAQGPQIPLGWRR
jgi:hypothetical protein